jgi:hypothetical protein
MQNILMKITIISHCPYQLRQFDIFRYKLFNYSILVLRFRMLHITITITIEYTFYDVTKIHKINFFKKKSCRPFSVFKRLESKQSNK